MKEIIVPTDLSDKRQKSVQFGAFMAAALGQNLKIVYAFEEKKEIIPANTFFTYETHLSANHDVYNRYSNLREELNKKDGLSAEYLALNGSLEDILNKVIKEHPEAVIVLAKECVENLGSLVGRKNPLLIVPSDFEINSLTSPQFIFATDLERINDWDVLSWFKEVAQRLNATVNIFYVRKEDVETPDEVAFQNERLELIENYFNGLNVTTQVVHRDNVVEATEEFSRQRNATLLTMVSHNRGFIENLFHKSVTKEMALHTHVPFLAIPDGEEELNETYSTNYW